MVVAYGLILPQPILDAPRLGCLNIHASLLPRWRGAAPIHRAVIAGDTETGICIMQMEAGLDTGPVLLRREMPIAPDDTTGALHDKLAELGAHSITAALSGLEGLVPVPQGDAGVTYAEKIDKAEARIDWSQPGEVVDRTIRGMSPFPGAWFEHQGTRIKALHSEHVSAITATPGTVLDDKMTIACGTGAVRLTRLQRAGKGVQDIETFMHGYDMPVGTQLGEV